MRLPAYTDNQQKLWAVLTDLTSLDFAKHAYLFSFSDCSLICKRSSLFFGSGHAAGITALALQLPPVFSNVADYSRRHNRVGKSRMSLTIPAQTRLAGSTAQRYRSITVGGTVIARRESHGTVHLQPAGRIVMRSRCLLQNAHIKIHVTVLWHCEKFRYGILYIEG